MNNRFLLLYAAVLNAAAFVVFGVDKEKAIHGKWRIRESVLLFLSFAGGSAGALLAMLLFRHKIRKMRFIAGVPLMLLLQAAAVFMLLHGLT